jgi:hypothetical protein
MDLSVPSAVHHYENLGIRILWGHPQVFFGDVRFLDRSVVSLLAQMYLVSFGRSHAERAPSLLPLFLHCQVSIDPTRRD